jgi:transcriptional antiterminator RfaH
VRAPKSSILFETQTIQVTSEAAASPIIKAFTMILAWIMRTSPLFPCYAFVLIELQWHAARWSPGVLRLVFDGDRPARVPDKVIAELRGRERNGLVELPPPPRLKRGDRVLVRRGPFADRLGLYDSQAPHERVAILLTWLGSQRRVELPVADVAPA